MPDSTMKTSRLMTRLDDQIARASTQHDADCKQAERAVYLARLGRTEDARAVAAALRQRYNARPHVEISVWIHLVEGLIAHFSDVDPAAHQKIQRAHALSVAANLKRPRALSGAWLATMEYARLDIDAMCIQLRDAIHSAGLDHHAARARIALVIGQSMHLSRRTDLARIWYARVRFHTLPDGDDSTISALMHGSASLHMAILRQSSLAGLSNVDGSETALIGAESNQRFDELNGISTLSVLTPLLTAQIHSLRENYGEANRLYEQHLDKMVILGAQRFLGNLLADRAWCRISLGMVKDAEDDAYAAIVGLGEDTQIDDRAATHSRLAQVFDRLRKPALASKHAALARVYWREFSELQAHILAGLRSVTVLWEESCSKTL